MEASSKLAEISFKLAEVLADVISSVSRLAINCSAESGSAMKFLAENFGLLSGSDQQRIFIRILSVVTLSAEFQWRKEVQLYQLLYRSQVFCSPEQI
jgi:hypothetical protein